MLIYMYFTMLNHPIFSINNAEGASLSNYPPKTITS